MRKVMNKIYAPLWAVLWNLMLAFLTYQVARLAYWLENSDMLRYTCGIIKSHGIGVD